MLDEPLLLQLKTYFQRLIKPIVLVLQPGEHHKKEELKEFLEDLASASNLISIQERDFGGRSGVSFALECESKVSGIEFSGIPSGHEFTSLILAIMQLSGIALNLDANVQKAVQNLNCKEELHFEIFVSLSCTNCPEVVQTLNQFAQLNPLITVETIDGALFRDEIEARNVQGVPSVFLNRTRFADGRIEPSQLLAKLLERYPASKKDVVSSDIPLQDVLVIGGGPAGTAAAVYAARKGLKVTVIAQRLGGQVKDTLEIENLIGTLKTTGEQLALNLRQHIAVNASIVLREGVAVKSISPAEGDRKHHQVVLQTGEMIETRTLILATGAKWRELGVPGEKEHIGRGVAFCPHCDGPFFKDKKVAVIGGGNSGIEAAIDLAGICEKVVVFEFAETLNADQVLIDALYERSNVEVLTSVAVQEVLAANGRVSGLAYRKRDNNEEIAIDLSGIFVQIGLAPNTDFLKNSVKRNEYGEILINERCETSTAGIFAAGDCTTVPYKQIVVAMGEGAKAALSAFNYLVRS
ncbi:MAG: alkyl hydroperoxide reductase subunit F [Cardiobacteriaceae bacterium]|nr:alkyl hydroperoxide reductase subunit F [Cardiobacteriaceae bacterium]